MNTHKIKYESINTFITSCTPIQPSLDNSHFYAPGGPIREGDTPHNQRSTPQRLLYPRYNNGNLYYIAEGDIIELHYTDYTKVNRIKVESVCTYEVRAYDSLHLELILKETKNTL